MPLQPLPIDPILPGVVDSLERTPCLVLQASPGSGKTTRLPPALLRARFRGERGEILVLEPRRLAAKMAARRVAEEMGEAVGATTGYQFRFENATGPRTQLRFLTEGILMRRLIGDPRLQGVAAVVLDEFHERHLHGDIALAFLRHLQQTARPDLRVVVMSATLDTEAIAAYLGGCPVFRVEARQYEVRIGHLPSPPARHLDLTVRDGVAQLLEEGERGDILVFLPGMGEIRRAASALEPLAKRKGLAIAPLHGELSREEQDFAIARGSRQKIILSTNVAETSLTVEGVTAVVDSGLHRIASHSWWSGVPSLRTRAISRASAIQRAGRAGRTAPGRCLRLYTRGELDSRPAFETPEIQRADLCQTVLELKSLGVGELARFPWFERPSAQSLDASWELLWRLGALSERAQRGEITALGQRMVTVPAHPRVARLLIEGERRGVLEDAATLAALIMEGRLETLDALAGLQGARADALVQRARSHLLGSFRGPRGRPEGSAQERLAFCVLSGFPDRVARKRPGQDPAAAEVELVFSAGGSARVANGSALAEGDTFVVLDVQERQGIGQARASTRVESICLVQPEWLLDLEPTQVEERDDLAWDEQRGRVAAFSRLAYGELVLSESRGEPDLGNPALASGAARLLAKAALGIDPARLASMGAAELIPLFGKFTDSEALEACVARASLIARHVPESGVGDPLAGTFGDFVLRRLEGKSSLQELRETDWAAAVAGPNLHRFEEYAPTLVTLGRGRRVRVHYPLGQNPWIESRLQDFFGMKKGPAILKGRLPLTLHLLAPNQRAVQVTQDLAGFWARGYAEVRKELFRRYPRHSWPESPPDAESSDD